MGKTPSVLTGRVVGTEVVRKKKREIGVRWGGWGRTDANLKNLRKTMCYDGWKGNGPGRERTRVDKILLYLNP